MIISIAIQMEELYEGTHGTSQSPSMLAIVAGSNQPIPTEVKMGANCAVGLNSPPPFLYLSAILLSEPTFNHRVRLLKNSRRVLPDKNGWL